MPDETQRILVVANRTASTPHLLHEVKQRSRDGARFALMIPPESGDDWSSQDAVALLERACDSQVDTVDAGPNAADTIHRAVADGDFGVVIVSTKPEHHRLWFHHDLPARLKDLGAQLIVIPPEPDKWGPVEGFPPESVPHAVNPAGIAGLGNY